MSAVPNPPAFPHVTQSKRAGSDTIYTHVSEGMTLRDWFAGQALIGILGASTVEAIDDVCQGVRGGRPIAYGAYALADAMLEARAKAQAIVVGGVE